MFYDYCLVTNQLQGHPTSPNLHYHPLQGHPPVLRLHHSPLQCHPHFVHLHHAPLQGPRHCLYLLGSYSNLLTMVHLRTTTQICLYAIHLPGCHLMVWQLATEKEPLKYLCPA